jgi:hypothetical protein
MVDETTPLRPADWPRLSREQKRQWRFNRWRERARQTEFVSSEAAAACAARLERLIAVYNVEEPDRVPVAQAAGQLPLRLAGIDYSTSIYHPERAVPAFRAFNDEHADELENATSWAFTGIAAPALDTLGFRMYAYPGHGMSSDGLGFQFLEGEYMRADEYDAFIRDPSDFWLRTYLPRAFGVFEPLASLQSLTGIVEINSMQLWPLASPQMESMLERLLAAGKELRRYQGVIAAEESRVAAHGFPPSARSLFAKAPFDTLGDTLRGTREVIMDMFRQPDRLLEALDVVADLTISSVLGSAGSDSVGVFFPLHKGADGWMSEEQFLRFYWPTLRRVVDAFIEEGLLVGLFAEGCFDTRLELVNEFPKGAVTWEFDRTDMAKAKRILGGSCSIEGNVPSSLLVAGTPEAVKAECRRLIETCAPGGGYILGPGAIPEFPKLENLKAMAGAAREYGVYASR